MSYVLTMVVSVALIAPSSEAIRAPSPVSSVVAFSTGSVGFSSLLNVVR
jgi:hypothetical protein